MKMKVVAMRVPIELAEWIEEEAKKAMRSINSQGVWIFAEAKRRQEAIENNQE